MVFTIEDFRKIQEWLEINGIKDTQLEGVDFPFRGDEIVTLVQNGKNVSLPIMDFIAQITVLGGNIAPDGEDLGVNPQGFVSFKDKQAVDRYDKGYKIIRKSPGNIITTQDFNVETIHEIRYRFDLNGGAIILPVGTELLFKGGSFHNGHIVFNNSTRPTKLLNAVGDLSDYISDCTFEGSYIMAGSDIELIRDMVIDILINDIDWEATADATDNPTGPTAEVDLEITDI